MFRFKQFAVSHDLCAMKVGTDGVLLGSWADTGNSDEILDVGTGSGLIALMLAQRSNANVTGIDIDEGAYLQATLNAGQSPFGHRIQIHHISFMEFSPNRKFDLIVSNPPYFQDSLKSPDHQRSLARHTVRLPFTDLVVKSVSLLNPTGKLALIVPFEAFSLIDRIASDQFLYLVRRTDVKPTIASDVKRILLEYSPCFAPMQFSEIAIEISRHVYSEDYINLTRDFYLKM